MKGAQKVRIHLPGVVRTHCELWGHPAAMFLGRGTVPVPTPDLPGGGAIILKNLNAYHCVLCLAAFFSFGSPKGGFN